MEPIELEAKSDRELLIQVVGKVNEISNNIKQVCNRVDSAEKEATKAADVSSNLTAELRVLKSRVDNHSKYMAVIFGFQLSTLGVVIASFLRQVWG